MNMSNKKIKVIFMGTPDFAVPSLENLFKDPSLEIAAVITQPDRPAKRNQALTPPPIKLIAQKFNLSIFQPLSINEIYSELKKIRPDLILVVAYAQLIPEKILNLPAYGAINIHASLLPCYRGAACIQAAILNNDQETGVTLIKMDKKLDQGPIIAQVKIKINADDTGGSLTDKLSRLGADLLTHTLHAYISGQIKLQKQNDSQASYVNKLKKSDGLINWNEPAETIERLIRAMYPWPSAFTLLTGKLNLKILAAEVGDADGIKPETPGKIFIYDKNMAVHSGQGFLIIKTIQPAGKNKMTGTEFLRGRPDAVGEILR